MTDSTPRKLLERLVLASGVPGHENEVRGIVRETLADVGTLSYDRLGSVLCEKTGDADGPRVLIDGHMDEVGFMVQSVSASGLLQFLPLGGWWGHVLLAQRMTVVTEDGRKIPGIVGSKPPHFLPANERSKVLSIENMYIDIGAVSRQEVHEFGVQVGDPVVPHAEFIELANPAYLSCKAFDDRVGVGLMCETLRGLGRDHPNVVIGVAATQEEVGCRGARTAATLARPDVALVLEATPADDLPGFTNNQAVLGSGPQIRFFDPTAISNRRLVRQVETVAREVGISVQIAVRRSGGTNASAIHGTGIGVPTVVIGVPARYIHTHVGIIHWQDYEDARTLLKALVTSLDRNTVDALVRFED